MACGLEKKLKILRKQRVVILAEDEASLFFQATLTSIWQPKGKTIRVKTYSGQDKVSFYGALNLNTGKEHTMRCQRQNQRATIRFLRYIRRLYPRKRITILWDGAPWHKGRLIRAYLRKVKRFFLLPFPPYTPEFNPQEKVWRQARRNVSHNHGFRTFPKLQKAFQSYLKKNRFKSNFLKDYG